MNRIFLMIAVLVISASAVAAPISCRGGKWSVSVSSNQEKAVLSKWGKKVQWGNLFCYNIFTAEIRPEGNPVLSCQSRDVVDAGYNVYIFRPRVGFGLRAWLSRTSIVGSKRIANLRCAEALHR